MELIETNLSSLFAQLGESNNGAEMEGFFERHTPLPGCILLH